jgi:hypothetical protein
MSGFADRIFGYFEILLQVQVPGTGTVAATQILIYIYLYKGSLVRPRGNRAIGIP